MINNAQGSAQLDASRKAFLVRYDGRYGTAQASWPMLVADKKNAFNRIRQLVELAARVFHAYSRT